MKFHPLTLIIPSVILLVSCESTKEVHGPAPSTSQARQAASTSTTKKSSPEKAKADAENRDIYLVVPETFEAERR